MPTEKAPRELDQSIMDLAQLAARYSVGDSYALLLLADEVRQLRQSIEAKS